MKSSAIWLVLAFCRFVCFHFTGHISTAFVAKLYVQVGTGPKNN